MQDGDPAGGVDRIGQRPKNFAVGVRRVDVGEILRHGLSGHGQAVAVQESGVQQCFHHHRHTADAVDVVHHVAAERLDIGQMRDSGADPVEVGQ